MINKIYDILVSMKTMVVLILVFALSIGTATIIENDFGTEAAKTMVYNADWFSVLLLLLLINLVGIFLNTNCFENKSGRSFYFIFRLSLFYWVRHLPVTSDTKG